MIYLVKGSKKRVGVSTICVGLAALLNESGKSVSLLRLGDDDGAHDDARMFADIDFAQSSGAPLLVNEFEELVTKNSKDIYIVEASSTLKMPAVDDLFTILVTDDIKLVTGKYDLLIHNHAKKESKYTIVENAILAATNLETILNIVNAQMISSGGKPDKKYIENVLIGPISHDATDSSYFEKFNNKLIVTRSEKVDLALGALATKVECLLLCGGNEPSPILIDRVLGAPETTLALTEMTTTEAIEKIGSVIGTEPIVSNKKILEAVECFKNAVELSDITH
jgi:BioD-like phosphotransacetylase family protein